MSEVKRWQPEIVYDGKTPRISKREWVHGIYVEHSDYAALERVLRECRDALKRTRSFLCTHPEYQGGWVDAEDAMNMSDAALAAAEALEEK